MLHLNCLCCILCLHLFSYLYCGKLRGLQQLLQHSNMCLHIRMPFLLLSFHVLKSFICCFYNLVFNLIQVIFYEGLNGWIPYNFHFLALVWLLSMCLRLLSSLLHVVQSSLCHFLSLIPLLFLICLQYLVIVSLVY
jgi:hypothetical protein